MLRLYGALMPVQERAYSDSLPLWRRAGWGQEIPQFVADKVLPGVIDVTVSSGPTRLRDGVISVFCTADLPGLIGKWLDQQSLDPFETYLARASASPVLEAAVQWTESAEDERASPSDGGKGGGSLCPKCHGLPQVSYFSVTGETLLTGPRYLVCSRCSNNWIFSRMTCAGCGESDGNKLPIYQEEEQFPHVRVDGCRTCKRYLLTFDLRRDTRAVPIVDELAALPLDLFARDQGLTKITPNLMGN
jgi:hypothetical protein